MMSMQLSNIAVLNILGADYHCIISKISKSEAKGLIQNIDLTEKSGTLSRTKSLISHIKTVKEIMTFVDIIIEKLNTHCYKSPFFRRLRY